MQKIKDLFDYMYYRIYKFYYKWDNKDGITATVALSMFQSLSFWLVVVLIAELFFIKSEIAKYSKFITMSWAASFLILSFVNEIYYSQEIIKLLEKKWEKESLKVKREKGWLVFFLLLLPWVILLLL